MELLDALKHVGRGKRTQIVNSFGRRYAWNDLRNCLDWKHPGTKWHECGQNVSAFINDKDEWEIEEPKE